MAATAANVLMGVGTLYRGAFGATEPADTAVGDPPDSGSWTDIGATTDDVSVSIKQDFAEIEVDQTVDIIGRRLTKRDLSISTNMAEATLENLVVAANSGGSITTGSGWKKFTPTNDVTVTQPTYCALLFDGFAPGTGKSRKVIGRRMLNSESTEMAYKKADVTVLKVSWSAHFVSTSVAPYVIVDEA